MNTITLQWHTEGPYLLAWIDDQEYYTIRPVVFVSDRYTFLEWELRINNAIDATHQLLGTFFNTKGAQMAAQIYIRS